MFSYVILTLSVATQCFCLEVQFKAFDKQSYRFSKRDEAVVNNKYLMETILKIPVHNYVSIRYDDENEILEVFNEDFKNFEYIWLENTKLETLPRFQNLTNVIAINLMRNHLKKIDNEAFTSTSVAHLYIGYNEISQIEADSFGPSICWMQLAYNSLDEFSEKWFQDPSRIKVLNLAGNNISHFKTNHFQRFKTLNDLSLAFNPIKRIDPRTFSFTNKIDWLHLQNTELRELNENIFGPNITISRLNIQYNNLTYLSDEFMSRVKISSFINIIGNPWQCTCFEKIRRWTPWNDYGSDFYKQKSSSEPYCVKSVESPQYCDPNPLDKEELISIFNEDLVVKSKMEDRLNNPSISPCRRCDICYLKYLFE